MTAARAEVGPNRFRERFARYYEEFHIGDICEHRPGRTLTETDNTWFTLLTMNPQEIQLKLGETATRLQAGCLLTYDAARDCDPGERCDMEAGMATIFTSEAAVDNSLEAMSIHGAGGYSKELHIKRHFRDASLRCVGEGTNEAQRRIIAKQLIERTPE